MRIPNLLHGLRLLVLGLPLASCLTDERTSWTNPADPASPAWVEREARIVAPGFYPEDTLFLEVGQRLKVYQNYSVDPTEAQGLVTTWTFRNLETTSTFSIVSSTFYGAIDTLLPRGSWRVRTNARTRQGGVYTQDSMVLVVADTGTRPRLRLPPDTILLRPGGAAWPGMLTGLALPLAADDPRGRRIDFTYMVQREGGPEGLVRWTPSIELRDIDGFGRWRVKVEAMNSVGLWDTGSFLVTLREDTISDGVHSYRIGAFGKQVWMLENLRTVPTTTGGSWCYGPDTANCDTYGRLYDWATATAEQGRNLGPVGDSDFTTRIRGICPEGWHLPSFDEMMKLKIWLKQAGSIPGAPSTTLLPDERVGRALEADTLWKAFWPDTTWRGSSGFALLPGGYRNPANQEFEHLGAHTGLWTSSHLRSDWARAVGVIESEFYAPEDSQDESQSVAGKLLYWDMSLASGFYVRCLED